MHAADTTPDAEAVQRAVLRAVTPAQRLAFAFDMSDAARQAVRALVRLLHGDDLCRAWPTLPLPDV